MWLQCCNSAARIWRDIAISVPAVVEMPDAALQAMFALQTYPTEARLVIFGHYWLSGAPVLQVPNVLCLDHSAGKDRLP